MTKKKGYNDGTGPGVNNCNFRVDLDALALLSPEMHNMCYAHVTYTQLSSLIVVYSIYI